VRLVRNQWLKAFALLTVARLCFAFDYKVSFTAKELAEKKADYNYTIQDPRLSEREGLSVFAKDTAGKVFQYVFRVCAWHRHGERRLSIPRPRSEGTRRGRPPAILVCHRNEYDV